MQCADHTVTAYFISVATEKRVLACGLLPGADASGGARALGALGGAACARLALGCACYRASGCAKRMDGVGWLGSPAMAFYISAGVSSMRHAVPHTALPAPARSVDGVAGMLAPHLRGGRIDWRAVAASPRQALGHWVDRR